jgi:hypothetical protein
MPTTTCGRRHRCGRGAPSANAAARRWPPAAVHRTIGGYRRLNLRYERCARLFAAFLNLAAALTCYKKLTT